MGRTLPQASPLPLHFALLIALFLGWASGLTTCTSAMKAFLLEAFTTGVLNTELQEYIGRGTCLLDESTGYGPLHAVSSHGGDLSGSLVQLLVESHKASVLQQSATETTPLHVAANHGSYFAATALCSEASDEGILAQLLATNESQGQLALDVAETTSNWRIVKLLVGLNSPRSDDSTEFWAESPSETACSDKAINAAVLGDLNALKASVGSNSARYAELATCVSRPKEAGRTLLHVAVACADYPDLDGFSTTQSSVEVVEFLLANGAKSTWQDADGNTPVSLATKSNIGSLFKLLTKNATASDLTLFDDLGRTPLHVAARAGSEKAVKSLLLKGVSATTLDVYGKSALDYAMEAKHRKVIDAIEMVLAVNALNGELIWDSAETLWTDVASSSEWYIVALAILGAVVAAFCLACGVYYTYHRLRRARKGVVRALHATDTTVEKGNPNMDKSLRAAANMLQAGSAPDWKVPLGQLMSRGEAQSGSESDGPKAIEDDSDSGSKRGSRRKRAPPADKPDRPVVVVAPNSPTGNHPNTVRDSQDLSASDTSISPIKESGRDKDIPSELLGQLRKELRQRETARGVRLPTPPMDTTGETAFSSPTRGLGPDAKRSHQLPGSSHSNTSNTSAFQSPSSFASPSPFPSPAPSLSPGKFTSAVGSSPAASSPAASSPSPSPAKSSGGAHEKHKHGALGGSGSSRSASAPPSAASNSNLSLGSASMSKSGASFHKATSASTSTSKVGKSPAGSPKDAVTSSPRVPASSFASSSTHGPSSSKVAKSSARAATSASPTSAQQLRTAATETGNSSAATFAVAGQPRTSPSSSLGGPTRRRRSASSTDSRGGKTSTAPDPGSPDVALPAALRR